MVCMTTKRFIPDYRDPRGKIVSGKTGSASSPEGLRPMTIYVVSL